MGRFDNIKTAIDANIKTNGNQAITGGVMNSVLKQFVDATVGEFADMGINTDSALNELNKATFQYVPSTENPIATFEKNGFLNESGQIIENSSYSIYRVYPKSTYILYDTEVSFGSVLPIIAAYDDKDDFIGALAYSNATQNQKINVVVEIPSKVSYCLFVVYNKNAYRIDSINKIFPQVTQNDISAALSSAFNVQSSDLMISLVMPYIHKSNAFVLNGKLFDNAMYDTYRIDISDDALGYCVKNMLFNYGTPQMKVGALYDESGECVDLLMSVEKTGREWVDFSFINNKNASYLLFSVYKNDAYFAYPYAYKIFTRQKTVHNEFVLHGYVANEASKFIFVENEDWRCTPMIKVDDEILVCVNADNYYVTSLLLYDKNFKLLSFENNTGQINRVISSLDAQYIRVCTFIENINQVSIIRKIDRKFEGKNIAFLGDSITEQGYVTNALSANRGCNILNYGVGGSTLSSQGNKHNPELDNFVTRFDNVITPNIEEGQHIDYFIMWGGINDFAAKNTLGQISQANNEPTFYASLHHLAQKQREVLGNTPILWITPLHDNYSQGSDAHYDWKIANGVFSYNNNGNAFLYEFVNAIKEVAGIYGIKVLDLHSVFPAPQIKSDLYLDRIHPNENGGILLAEYIYKALCEMVV